MAISPYLPMQCNENVSVPAVVTVTPPTASDEVLHPSAAVVPLEQTHTGATAKAVANVTATGLVPPVTRMALSVPPAATVPESTVGKLAVPLGFEMCPPLLALIVLSPEPVATTVAPVTDVVADKAPVTVVAPAASVLDRVVAPVTANVLDALSVVNAPVDAVPLPIGPGAVSDTVVVPVHAVPVHT